MKKIKTFLFLAVFSFGSFNVFTQTSSLISNCGDFVSGPTAWPYVLVATTPDSGAASQGAQTFTMNVTDTASGANFRVAKTTANGNWFFGPAIPMTLGSNTITVAAVTFDRAVKFQFSNGNVEFDALVLNGVATNCICASYSATDVVMACDSYTWIDGITYTSSNNTATDTLISTAGCDSVITLDLTITSLNASVIVINDTTLQSQSVSSGVVYQWVDCNDNFAPVLGETNATFSTQTPGDYAVEISLNNCSVISDCYTIAVISGNELLNSKYGIQLFPNPTTNDLILSLKGVNVVDIVVIDTHGRVLLKQPNLFDQDRISLSTYVAGTYFVKIITPEENKTIAITKQ